MSNRKRRKSENEGKWFPGMKLLGWGRWEHGMTLRRNEIIIEAEERERGMEPNFRKFKCTPCEAI